MDQEWAYSVPHAKPQAGGPGLVFGLPEVCVLETRGVIMQRSAGRGENGFERTGGWRRVLDWRWSGGEKRERIGSRGIGLLLRGTFDQGSPWGFTWSTSGGSLRSKNDVQRKHDWGSPKSRCRPESRLHIEDVSRTFSG